MLRLMLLLGICCCCYSCAKKSDCEKPALAHIKTNSPVVKGWDLHLESSAGASHRFRWSGPNGWNVNYEYAASNANLQTVPAITEQGAGTYKVQLVNTAGCVEFEGSVDVEVIDPPTAPCTIAANTSTASIAGVGNYSFVTRSFMSTPPYYTIQAKASLGGGGHFVQIGFAGTTPPKPGVYTVTDGFWGSETGEVGVHISTGTYQFLGSGGKVYVTSVNGKLSLSFCDLSFSNPIPPFTPFKASANITQP